jgi:hypothetical protein
MHNTTIIINNNDDDGNGIGPAGMDGCLAAAVAADGHGHEAHVISVCVGKN